MAGDWIKMECSTPDKPEVLAITALMGWDDEDLTVGKLFKLWRWFDQHTTNGNAIGVTTALLNKKVGVSGFVEAVESVGWLSVTEAGIRIKDFDRHNGASAKQRSQTAKRVANCKSNAKGNGASVTLTEDYTLPREEKRREEKKENTNAARQAARFDDFWNAWPKSERKQDRTKCLDKWTSAKLDTIADIILDDIGLKKLTEKWAGGYIEAPLVYLNNKRWEDGVTPDSFTHKTPSGILAGAI